MNWADHSLSFDLVSTWTDDCGIFEYVSALLTKTALTNGLAAVFAREVTDDLAPNAIGQGVHPEVYRSWNPGPEDQTELSQKLLQSKAHALWFQYHPSFFSKATIETLAHVLPQTAYRRRVLTVHNPEALADSAFLQAFTDVVVHNEDALASLGELGSLKAHVIPHFIYSRDRFERREPGPQFTVTTAGFAAANKQVPQLIDAFAIAHSLHPDMKLHILTSPLPTHSSHFEQCRIVAAIKSCSARDSIKVDIGPKSMNALLSKISSAHLMCMPYAETAETASGAARLALSAGVPLLRSKSSIFSDLPGGDFVLENTQVEIIAEAILMLSQSPILLEQKRLELDDFYQQLSPSKIAQSYVDLLN